MSLGPHQAGGIYVLLTLSLVPSSAIWVSRGRLAFLQLFPHETLAARRQAPLNFPARHGVPGYYYETGTLLVDSHLNPTVQALIENRHITGSKTRIV